MLVHVVKSNMSYSFLLPFSVRRAASKSQRPPPGTPPPRGRGSSARQPRCAHPSAPGHWRAAGRPPRAAAAPPLPAPSGRRGCCWPPRCCWCRCSCLASTRSPSARATQRSRRTTGRPRARRGGARSRAWSTRWRARSCCWARWAGGVTALPRRAGVLPPGCWGAAGPPGGGQQSGCAYATSHVRRGERGGGAQGAFALLGNGLDTRAARCRAGAAADPDPGRAPAGREVWCPAARASAGSRRRRVLTPDCHPTRPRTLCRSPGQRAVIAQLKCAPAVCLLGRCVVVVVERRSVSGCWSEAGPSTGTAHTGP